MIRVNLKHRFLVLLILACALYPISAHAVGIGVYSSGSVSNMKWNHEQFKAADFPVGPVVNLRPDGAASSFGGGIIIDSNLSRKDMFNYRFNLGIDSINAYTASKIKLKRINWVNTFGLRLYHTNTIRLWMGPQLSISYLWGNDSIRNYDLLFNYVSFSMLPISYKRKYMMIGLNLGFALGLNYNFSKSITLSIESGFRGGFGIDLLKKRKSYDSSSDIDTTPSGEFEGYEGYLSLGVLYRIKESIE